MTSQFYNLSEISGSTHSDKKKLKVLLLADNRHQANVVQDHINGFAQHSNHQIHIVNPIHEKPPLALRFWKYDVVLIHYSIFILGEYYLPAAWAKAIRNFRGIKAQIIQDEHRYINSMKQQMHDLDIGMVFSSLNKKNLFKVYGGELLKNVTFYSCIPGYISENYFQHEPPPIAKRPLDVVYRGRTLPAYLGRHALEKKIIGDQFLAIAQQYGLKVDISSDENRRIYGDDWANFLMSGRATLGGEGGASIFDFDGTLVSEVNAYLENSPHTSFEEIWSKFLKSHEGNVVHKTITPKIFEAIAAKTALILYPGEYRGILTAYRHYIPYERDGSNIEEVVSLIKDEQFLQNMVDQVHQEIMFRPDLSNKFYVNQIDLVLIDKYKKIKPR